MASLKKTLLKKKYVAIKLKKTVTNHLEIKGQINDINGRFILDTGASNSCVGIDLQEYFKLEVQESEIKAAGAGAIGMETLESKKNSLLLGEWKINKFSLVLFDLSHVNSALEQHEAKSVHGIIGADILEKGKAIIDYNKKLLYLKRSKK
jgi:hypothetical protein